MNNYYFKLKIFLFCFIIIFSWSLKSLELKIEASDYEKMNLLILKKRNISDFLEQILKTIKADLEFADQFNVVFQEIDQVKTKNEIKQFEKSGFPFVIFIDEKERKIIEWRLYDALEANMIAGKKIQQVSNDFTIAHNIAQQINKELTGENSPFLSVIAACKKVKKSSHICTIHPIEISKPKILINEPTSCFGLRWNFYKPILYYSKNTPYNVRLLSIDSDKIKKIIANFDGINMTPTISEDGKIVLVLTKNGKEKLFKYEFDEKAKKGKYTLLTKLDMHIVSPTFINENQILCCVIDHYNTPKIAIFDIERNNIEYLIDEYSVSPSYLVNNGKICYCKKNNGFMQIFTMDLKEKKEKQITFDKTDKDCCSWSPCGNYISFCVETKNKSRIAIINLLNDKIKFITPENEFWSDPIWSPNYNNEILFL